MTTTRRRPVPEMKSTAGGRIMRGFDYLTLDPSPRLRRMRVEQQRTAKDPIQVIREAWLSVGAAIRQALQVTSGKSNSLE
jgi:hypothetical protein